MRRFLLGSVTASVGMGLTLVLAALAPGQTGAAPKPVPPDSSPLARYVPRDHLVGLIEFNGLEAQGESWRGSALYKVLNQTTTGAMFEDLIRKYVDEGGFAPAKGDGSNPNPQPGDQAKAAAKGKLTGSEVVSLIEHVGRHGFALGLNGQVGAADPRPGHTVLVVRGAARKDARPLFGKLLGTMMAPPAKAQAATKGTRRIVVVSRPDGPSWAWWTEKDDLVLTASEADVDLIAATIDGKQPNALEEPRRVELSKAEGPFQPVALAFFNAEAAGTPNPMTANLQQLGLKNLDYRIGFEGPALMTVTHISAPSPRAFPLNLFDQPTFDVKSLPPIPSHAENLSIVGLDLRGLYDRVSAWAKQNNPNAAAQLEAFEKAAHDRTRRKLREEILPQFGHHLAIYQTPSPAPTGLAGATTLLRVPKLTVTWEVPNPAEFTKVLAELMILVNQEMAKQYEAMNPKPKDEKAEKGETKKAPNPNPQFVMVSASPRTYSLRLPAQLAALTNLNLTVTMGKKHLIIATAPDAAREAVALEEKTDGRWTPTGDLADVLDRLPAGLTYLQIEDPRNTVPETLASLPTTLQNLNTSLAATQAKLAAATAPPAGTPGVPGQPGPFAQSSSGLDPAVAGPGPRDYGVEGSGSGSSSAIPMPGIEPGVPGPAGGAPKAAEPAKPPRAAEVRALLFPGSTGVAVDAQGIRIISREAFPNVSPSNAIGALFLMRAASPVPGSLPGGLPIPAGAGPGAPTPRRGR